jgi:transposase
MKNPQKRQELSDFDRGQIIGMNKVGTKKAEISRVTGKSYSTVTRTINRYETTGSVTPKKRLGPSPILKDRDLRVLERIVKKNRNATLQAITNEFNQGYEIKVSKHTIRRRLHDLGLKACVAVSKPLLSKKNIVARLSWAKDHKKKATNWKHVVWSDESKFNLINSDGRTLVWRQPKDKYSSDCVQPKVQGNGGSVTVWGCFWYGGLGPLVIINQNITQDFYVDILAKHFYDWYQQVRTTHNIQLTFQEDNAPAHRGLYAEWWKKQTGIDVMTWPARSPDCNPIENIWDELDKQIRKRKFSPKTLKGLEQALKEEWKNIPEEKYRNLVDSMNRRVNAVIKAKGLHTKY